jgi:TPR repeat protein
MVVIIRGDFALKCLSLYVENMKKILVPHMKSSEIYHGLPEKLEQITILSDRILLACQNHPEFSKVYSIREIFEKAITSPKSSRATGNLLTEVERWLKAVLYFAFPDRWKLHKDSKRFNLYTAINELKLLDQNECESEDISIVKDKVKKLVWHAYDLRNFETHSTASLSEHEDYYLLYALATMVAPVYLHYNQIFENLRGLVIRPVDTSVEDLCASINSERQDNIQHFKGRSDFVQRITDKLTGDLQATGSYYLITGGEGIGKSSLCAKISEQLLKEQEELFPLDNKIRNNTPWLPGQLLHFGKWESDPIIIMRSLISQANTMLIEPMELPDRTDTLYRYNELAELQRSAEDYQMNYAVSGESFEPFTVHQNGMNNFLPRKVVDFQNKRQQTFQMDYNSPANQNTQNHNEIEIYKTLLVKVLRQLVREHGPVVMIIDALDEINRVPETFSFLPLRLPEGVSGLLTVRHNLGIDTWLQNHCKSSIETEPLTKLSRKEIPQFTGLDDAAGPDERKFNDLVYKKTDGWSMHVATISRRLIELDGDFSSVDVNQELRGYMDKQREKWLNSYNQNDPNSQYLMEVLYLLTLFEPISAIRLEDVQGYLEFKFKRYFDAIQLEKLLDPVAYQIQGLDTSKQKIKLSIRAFADSVRNRLGRNLNRTLEGIADWLIHDEEVDRKLLSDFIAFWINEGDKNQKASAKRIIHSLREQEEIERIKAVTEQMFKGIKGPSESFVYCVNTLAECNEPQYMFFYAVLLLNGDGIKKDIVESERWFRKAAELDNIPAMRALGDLLIDGVDFPQNKEEGESWLRKAIELDDKRATVMLATRLIDGDGLDVNVEEGYKLLAYAAESESENAIIVLANRLLSGKGLEKDTNKGKEWLIRAALELDSTRAMSSLGSRLLSGDGLEKNSEEGLGWLLKAAEKGHHGAMLELGYRMVMGDELEQNTGDGLYWIEKGAESGHEKSMLLLAKLYTEGTEVSLDVNLGKKWLIEATKMKSVDAMITLGKYYLFGLYNFPINKVVAEKWFETAIENDSDRARFILGWEYILGENLQKNINKGLKLLNTASENGYLSASNDLAILYLNGRHNVPVNLKKGESLLRSAAEKGSKQAKVNLAGHLIEGTKLQKDIDAGIQLLNEMIEKKYPMAILMLSQFYFEGEYLEKDIEKGKKVLLNAMEQNIAEAYNMLGLLYITGNYFDINVSEGERLLEKACDLGLVEAMEEYGRILMYGKQAPKNEEKGIEILQRAIKEDSAEAEYVVAMYYYDQLKDFELAYKYFYSGYRKGDMDCAVSLLYLYRRNELPDYADINIETILTMIKKNPTSISQVNHALLLTQNSKEIQDWRQADEIFKGLKDVEGVYRWWHSLLQAGDPEGNLVFAWLLRHRKVDDPEGKTSEERFEQARQHYNIHGWILHSDKKAQMPKR